MIYEEIKERIESSNILDENKCILLSIILNYPKYDTGEYKIKVYNLINKMIKCMEKNNGK